MKLRRYNKETLPSRMAVTVPTVRVSLKGHIVFNQAACEKMKIKDGDGVEFIQNEEAPKEWFVAINSGGGGQAYLLESIKHSRASRSKAAH